jgi:putative acetyltransferase
MNAGNSSIRPRYHRVVTVRPETPADYAAIHAVNRAAFAQPDEADLVDRLRAEGSVLLSLVADQDSAIVGHVLFTRMHVGDTPAVALAPVAVDPVHQRQGIGAALIRRGLDLLRDAGERIVIVVGHPAYYPRFGFSGAPAIEHPFPPEAFMALELTPRALADAAGAVRYPPAFGL